MACPRKPGSYDALAYANLAGRKPDDGPMTHLIIIVRESGSS